jgi:hypothetical protein
MKRPGHESIPGCGCDDGFDRRDFLSFMGLTAGAVAFGPLDREVREGMKAGPKKEGARVRAVFLYPPSKTFSEDRDGWWSWPGNEFDAEGRQKKYQSALKEIEKKLGMKIHTLERPVATGKEAKGLAQEIERDPLDGLLLIMFYNRSLDHANVLLEAAERAGIPAVFFIGLGVKHGPVAAYRRPGVYLIQSLDNFEAIEYGMRMINTRKLLSRSLLLSITEAEKIREGKEAYLGITVRVIPFSRYAETFQKIVLDQEARQWIAAFTQGAKEIRGITQEALENAARAHFALKQMLAEEGADGVTMNCLRRGWLKPCMSFSALNSELIPAACENDLPAAYSQMLGQLLLGRPGFQHNPCFETELNHYYASHCTCPTRLHGPEGGRRPYLMRRFAHTNEGSCAIQVFWKPEDPVTMVKYYPGEEPMLDVYAGRVIKSHPMPPAAGCTTNVEIEVLDREDVCTVKGHHNILFCGDFARKFRLFARLYRIPNPVHPPLRTTRES